MRKCRIRRYCAKGNERWTEQEDGWFHGFCNVGEIVPPSPMVGGHKGGQLNDTFAIVETAKDNRLQKVYIEDVQFVDDPVQSGERHCEYFVRSKDPNLGIKPEGEWKKGIFHGWSTDYEEFTTGPGLFPVAIIEDEEGGVHSVYAEFVRFKKEA